jgi:phosphocarrier protein FPr
VRTLDVGGDKPLAYLRVPAESNPYLGLRAARLSLRYPEIFRTQLRAILRAGTDSDLRLMFPMITRTEELDRLLELRDAAHRELTAENVDHRWPIPTGIMIETPAAVLLIASLVKRLDFVSIGTNDLTQYTLAAERGNAELADYADALHPVILQLIRQVVDETHRQGKPVAVCGEIAADPVAVPVLVGLGVDELSLAPPAIPRVKTVICNLAHAKAVELVKKILAVDNAGSARRLAVELYQNEIDSTT